jgi:threonine dehydratase
VSEQDLDQAACIVGIGDRARATTIPAAATMRRPNTRVWIVKSVCCPSMRNRLDKPSAAQRLDGNRLMGSLRIPAPNYISSRVIDKTLLALAF